MAIKKKWFYFERYAQDGVDIVVRDTGADNAPILAEVVLHAKDLQEVFDYLEIKVASKDDVDQGALLEEYKLEIEDLRAQLIVADEEIERLSEESKDTAEVEKEEGSFTPPDVEKAEKKGFFGG